MAVFKSVLTKKAEIANDTMSVYFQKPPFLAYLAGQHATLRLLTPKQTDGDGDDRTFSFTSIPEDEEVIFSTRIRDTAFKRNLKEAQEGLEVEIEDPRGSMILPKDTKRPLVFLCGGIGITPFISMIRQATAAKSDQKITLFYSNRTVNDAPFLADLKKLAEENNFFQFVPTMTSGRDGNWDGETGYINEAMISKYLPQTDDHVFYLAGPAGMVNSMMELLTAMKVDPLFIKSEDFGEYK